MSQTNHLTPFLKQVATHYLAQGQQLADWCFVFPNRRSSQFFGHYLQETFATTSHSQQATGSMMMPEVLTLADLLSKWTRTNAVSDVEAICALYDAYRKTLGDRAQPFDQFVYWSQLMVNDFNDIDQSLANADQVFANIGSLHEVKSNYLSAEVVAKIKEIFGENLQSTFFNIDDDASLWQQVDRVNREPHVAEQDDQQDVKAAYFGLWDNLSSIYHQYHTILQAHHVATTGMQLQEAIALAQQDKQLGHYKGYVFVGFGVLSAAEIKLFKMLRDSRKAHFWWDNAILDHLSDQDPGKKLIKAYCELFPAPESLEKLQHTIFDREPATEHRVRVVAVPSSTGQAKWAFREVERLLDRNAIDGSNAINTAIVLPDENLLTPLLHSVSNRIGSLNVTLGYPLRNASVVSLMRLVATLHHHARLSGEQWLYFREDVNNILSHPLIKTYFASDALQLTNLLAINNRFEVPATTFKGYGFEQLFAPAMMSDHSVQAGVNAYLDGLMAFCETLLSLMKQPTTEPQDQIANDESTTNQHTLPLQTAFVVMYVEALQQLKASLAEYAIEVQRNAVFYLIDRMIASLVIPFTGEPLRGMQIMGLLETRSLDFDNLIVLSMNERVFPRKRGINSLIPNFIRRAWGMSTIEQQEALMSYNFYRMLSRASEVTLIYNSSTQSLGSSEPSRYINQLEKLYGVATQHLAVNVNVLPAKSLIIEMPNDGIAARLYGCHETTDNDNGTGKKLSATAINEFINCPLQFYLHHIQGLNNDSPDSDFMDAGTFGSIIHDTLNEFYAPAPGQIKTITRHDIEQFKNNKLKATVKRYINRDYLHVDDNEELIGEPLLLWDTLCQYAAYVLNYDHDVTLKSEGDAFTILKCEQSRHLDMSISGSAPFRFYYRIDRVDQLSEGTVRIVDYKTGKDEKTTFSNMDDLFAPQKGRCKAILQLLLYCYAYQQENPQYTQLTPMIYNLRDMNQSGVLLKEGRNDKHQFIYTADNELVKDFTKRMGGVITTMFSKEAPFIQTLETNSENVCKYCNFINICRRQIQEH